MEAVPISQHQASRLAADDDARLADRARTDADAFAELYIRHREAVFSYLRGRLGDEDVALDVTAVTFERALAT